MSTESRLMPVGYYNATQEIRLSAYADTIVYEEQGKKLLLRAVRFGGYPEMVRGLADALYAGATLNVELPDEELHLICQAKQYHRQVTHDGVYAEATLMAKDDERIVSEQEDDPEDTTEESPEDAPKDAVNPPRKCIIFCEENHRDRLFYEFLHQASV